MGDVCTTLLAGGVLRRRLMLPEHEARMPLQLVVVDGQFNHVGTWWPRLSLT
jgi:hypothetical protein